MVTYLLRDDRNSLIKDIITNECLEREQKSRVTTKMALHDILYYLFFFTQMLKIYVLFVRCVLLLVELLQSLVSLIPFYLQHRMFSRRHRLEN